MLMPTPSNFKEVARVQFLIFFEKKSIKLLKELLKKYIVDFNPETDCYEKWMETVQDEVRELLEDEDYD